MKIDRQALASSLIALTALAAFTASAAAQVACNVQGRTYSTIGGGGFKPNGRMYSVTAANQSAAQTAAQAACLKAEAAFTSQFQISNACVSVGCKDLRTGQPPAPPGGAQQAKPSIFGFGASQSDMAFCTQTYAPKLTALWNQGKARKCREFVLRANDAQGHFNWCMQRPRAIAQRAIADNARLVAACKP